MKKSKILILYATMFSTFNIAFSQQTVFNKVKARFSKSAKDIRLVDKDADLVLDDGAQKLIVRNDQKPLDITYGDVQKVVFDVSTHMRGGGLGEVIGGLAGAALQAGHIQDYWCYIEYKKPDGSVQPYMLEIDKDSSTKVIEKMKAIFGDKVTVAEFAENEEKIEKDTLQDIKSKHSMKIDKKNHPMPEIKPEKALVVVVCPALAARHQGKGNQYKLHANDNVIAVNKMGTYGFAYLDPGEYQLVSQTENASGFRMNLEAGKGYYFLQDTFTGMWKSRTKLSRHTKELVMYELSGAYYSDWKRK
jgi:hypothetical protein